VPMKDLHGRWKFRHDIMYNHVGSNRFRHISYPHARHSNGK